MKYNIWAISSAAAIAVIGALTLSPAFAAPGSKTEGVKVVAAKDVRPVPLPPSVFPQPAATINGWVAKNDQTAIRSHAWALWAAMGAPSGQVYNGTNLPVWDTWWGTNEVFPSATATCGNGASAAAVERSGDLHGFHAPVQFHHAAGARGASGGTDAAGLVSFNKFSPGEAQFLLTSQPGPGGASYCYRTGTSLLALNAAWPASATPNQRGVNPFPNTSIEIKPVLGLVKATGFTAIPLWQGIRAAASSQPSPTTWLNCVLVSPSYSGPIRPATKAEIAAAQTAQAPACNTFVVGSLNQLSSFKMTAAEAASFNSQQGAAFASQLSAAAGDYAVLEAMHVSTKEISNWTWQTFYWQPTGTKDVGFPGNKSGQPAGLAQPLNQYAACTAYSQTTTPKSNSVQVCFSPYLETSANIPAGLTSNCMSCHAVAVATANTKLANYPANYATPINLFNDPSYFQTGGAQGTTHLDFSWAVQGAPLPPPPPPPATPAATR